MREIQTKLSSGCLIPEYKTEGAAGADLYAYLPDGQIVIKPGDIKKVPSGVHLNMQDKNLAVMLMPRSSLGMKQIKLANTIGLCDSDFLGDLSMLLENTGTEDFIVSHQDRLAQIVFFHVEQVKFKTVKEFDTMTARGEGGFGSTGK